MTKGSTMSASPHCYDNLEAVAIGKAGGPMSALGHDLAISFDRDFLARELETLDQRRNIQGLVEPVGRSVYRDLYHGSNDTAPAGSQRLATALECALGDSSMPATDTDKTEHDLFAAQQAVRDMQRAVIAVRGELELAHARREQEVQKAVAAGQDEIGLLKRTAASLREALEQAALTRDADVQAARAAAANEIAQLKATSGALREQLELARINSEHAVQAAHGASATEISQLKATAAALREQLELGRVHAEAGIQAERQRAQDDIAQLRASIIAMRETMDQHNGKP
jgi:hypothetical protein